MTFFHDLNKRLAQLASKQDAKQITESKQAEAVAKSPLTQALNEVGQRRGGHGEPEFVGIPGPAKGTKPSPKAITKGADREYYKSPGLMGEPERTRWRKKVEEPKVDEAGYSAKAGRAGKDLGKPGKNFSKIAKGAAERYGSKAAGERVAGAVLNKLRHPTEGVEESTLDGHTRKYGVVVVGHNDGKPVKMFDKESDAKAYADKGIRVGSGLKQGSVRTIVAPKNKRRQRIYWRIGQR